MGAKVGAVRALEPGLPQRTAYSSERPLWDSSVTDRIWDLEAWVARSLASIAPRAFAHNAQSAAQRWRIVGGNPGRGMGSCAARRKPQTSLICSLLEIFLENECYLEVFVQLLLRGAGGGVVAAGGAVGALEREPSGTSQGSTWRIKRPLSGTPVEGRGTRGLWRGLREGLSRWMPVHPLLVLDQQLMRAVSLGAVGGGAGERALGFTRLQLSNRACRLSTDICVHLHVFPKLLLGCANRGLVASVGAVRALLQTPPSLPSHNDQAG